jgi:UrcA family protein
MNTQLSRSGRSGGRYTASAAAILMALSAIVPVGTIAEQPTAARTVSVADVPLSDLRLSTPEGMRLARERLHTMAERICTDGSGPRDPSSRPAFDVCVDSTVASVQRHLDTLRQNHFTVLSTVTLAASVSLADLDLSTLEGADTARQRLEATARRLCGELARRRDLSYPPSYAACVRETLSRALVQADALAAARNTRTARRTAP